MKDRFLLWDQDGVLVDSEKWFFRATRDHLARLGVPFDRETCLRYQSEGRLYWDLARQKGTPEETIRKARIQRDRDWQRSLASEAIAIEDAPRGLRAALAAGLRCIIIRNDLMARQDFPGAYRVLDSVQEIPAALPQRSDP